MPSKYTGYSTSKTLGNYAALRGGGIEKFEGAPPDIGHESDASLAERYPDTSLTGPVQPKYTKQGGTTDAHGIYGPLDMQDRATFGVGASERLEEQGRAFTIGGLANQPTGRQSSDDRLDKEYQTANMIVQNEYLEKAKALDGLPPGSRQFQVLSGALESDFIQKKSKLDNSYKQTKKKFDELNFDNTIDASQTEFAKSTYMNRSPIYKFPDIKAPEQMNELDLGREIVKLNKVFENTTKDTPEADVIQAEVQKMQEELAVRQGKVHVTINRQPRMQAGPPEAVSAWMTPEEATKRYAERELPHPSELKEQGTEEAYNRGVELGYWK